MTDSTHQAILIRARAMTMSVVTPQEYEAIFNEGYAVWDLEDPVRAVNPHFTLSPSSSNDDNMRMNAWENGWWAGAKALSVKEGNSQSNK